MAQTQKMYLGGVPVIKNYLGENPIVSAGAIAQVFIPLTFEYLVVGGGGLGGWNRAAGGGAGGLLSGSMTLAGGTTYYGNVGSGSQDSTFDTLTAVRGGAGGAQPFGNGQDGGSGGGAYQTTLYGLGTSGQGNRGGAASGTTASGGGGGAGAVGSAGASSIGGAGGIGLQSAIDGTLRYYAGGGGAGGASGGGAGGNGGGGNGSTTSATAGEANTGGGGGGTYNNTGISKSGGSGIVVIRYLGTQRATGGNQIYSDGGYTVHKFTSSNPFTFTID